MGTRIRITLATGAAAMLAVLPAAPAAAAQSDCIFSGGEYVVYDAIDCAYYIIETAIG